MLDTLIKKLAVVLVLCGAIASLLYFTDLGALVNGQAKKKVEEFKKESNVEKVEDKIKDLKKLKLKDIIK